MSSMRTELFRVSDVVDALRDELLLLERQLDRDGERLRFGIEAVEVELQVVVGKEHKVGAKGGVEAEAGLGLKVLGLASGKATGEVSGEKGWSNALTQTVRLKLKPERVSGDEVSIRQAKPGTDREIKILR